MPESFSFTLYESISAGCFILAFENSGNIQKEVKEHERGRVFANTESVMDYFRGTQLTHDVEDHFQGIRKITPLHYRENFEG